MNSKVYVWDRLVRIFHWALVLLFLTSYLSGDENETLHAYSGYGILSLLAVRWLWGFVGSEHARFSNFVRTPAAAWAYIKGLFGVGGVKYQGHNPAGGLMTLVMLITLTCAGLSGLKLYGVEGHGPLAVTSMPLGEGQSEYQKREYKEHESKEHEEDHEDEYENEAHEEAEEFWEEIHEFFVNSSLFLIFLHILGVGLSSLKQRENLVVSMFTGYKER